MAFFSLMHEARSLDDRASTLTREAESLDDQVPRPSVKRKASTLRLQGLHVTWEASTRKLEESPGRTLQCALSLVGGSDMRPS